MKETKDYILDIVKRSKASSFVLSQSSGNTRNNAIKFMIEELYSVKEELFKENKVDVDYAKENGLETPLIKRLTITEKTFKYMIDRLTETMQQPDPLGKTLKGHIQPNGLSVKKITVPIGVIAIIYESRPNVTSDAASTCIKSGNSVILRGGKESIRSNIVIAKAMRSALKRASLPEDCIQLITEDDYSYVDHLLKMNQYIDLLIPRGGKSLIKKVAETSTIPTLKHYEGICHIYVSGSADIETALSVVINSKCQSVEVCNALEKLLIDKTIADKILPIFYEKFKEQNVELRGCELSKKLVPEIIRATEEDWSTEYLAPILTVKIVDNIDHAIEHINKFGSHHTDGIISSNINEIEKFISKIDSASIMVNSSTRLSGGGDYGMGAVVGISTDKLHARGPIGPEELTIYKWIAYGNGHIRE